MPFVLFIITSVSVSTITFTNSKATSTDPQYDSLISKWQVNLLGSGDNNRSDAIINNLITNTENKSANLSETMKTQDNPVVLWGTQITNKSSQITNIYTNIYAMAFAYEMKNSNVYHNANLKTKIIYALDWMYDNMYGPSKMTKAVPYDNWYDWKIGAPKQLVDTLMIMKSDIPSQNISKYLQPVNYFAPNTLTTVNGNIATGANKIWLSYVVFGSAILKRNTSLFNSTMSELTNPINKSAAVFNYVTAGDGFYIDGSFIQHDHLAYNGGYGIAMVNDLTTLISIFHNTSTQIDSKCEKMQIEWLFDAMEPFLYNGSVMSMVMGRDISRVGTSEINRGNAIVKAMVRMVSYADKNDSLKLKRLIKQQVTDNPSQNYEKIMSISELPIFRDIINNSSISPSTKEQSTKVFYNMDRVVQSGINYSFGISMSSSRIANYESINLENTKGWYTGDGMTYLYTNSGTNQFGSEFWQNVNPYKMAGTTVDTQTREAISVYSRQEYLSSKNFVGGASIGSYGVASMWLDSYSNNNSSLLCRGLDGLVKHSPIVNRTLEAQKSWFMFDNEIVALGAGITSNDDYLAETIVENRVVDSNNIISINGSTLTANSKKINNADYVSIDGVGGYYFPGSATINLQKTSTTPSFIEMWLEHGVKPQNQKYEYVLLPNMSKEDTKKYSDSPDIKIISNTNKLQAVKDNSSGITGIIFWESGTMEDINSNIPANVVINEKDNKYSLVVSDPTQLLSSGQIIINRSDINYLDADNGITVIKSGKQTKINIDFSKKEGGRAFQANFTLSNGNNKDTINSANNAETINVGSNSDTSKVEVDDIDQPLLKILGTIIRNNIIGVISFLTLFTVTVILLIKKSLKHYFGNKHKSISTAVILDTNEIICPKCSAPNSELNEYCFVCKQPLHIR